MILTKLKYDIHACEQQIIIEEFYVKFLHTHTKMPTIYIYNINI